MTTKLERQRAFRKEERERNRQRRIQDTRLIIAEGPISTAELAERLGKSASATRDGVIFWLLIDDEIEKQGWKWTWALTEKGRQAMRDWRDFPTQSEAEDD